MKKKGSCLVVGGGIGGVEASLTLAESGFKVFLLESSPSIGGIMAMLDKTFPTNDCSMCILSPKLVEASQHPNIEIISYAEVEKIDGSEGNFSVTYRQKPRYVLAEKCTGCASCSEACVLSGRIPDEFNTGLSKRAAIYVPFAQSVPKIACVDTSSCLLFTKGKCKSPCIKACEAKAIDFEQKEEKKNLQVGGIIIATGASPYDISNLKSYHPEHPNVVSSIQMERIMCASGPSAGNIIRPSDGSPVKKIAYIQCAGSRDINHNPYCSSVCCTYAIKQATVIKEHNPQIACKIFHIDMRTFGKGFEAFKRRASDEYGVEFVRFKIPSIEVASPNSLLVRYLIEDGWREEEYDIVVLSVGLTPNNLQPFKEAGVELNQFGFIKTERENPCETSVPGIFACGTASGPKDIPETVAQAQAAASKCSTILRESRGTEVSKKEYPPERDVRGEPPRVGVFVCHCGKNIAGVVRVKEVKEYAKSLPDVVYVEDNIYTCSSESCESIKRAIREKGLNRVVVAACTPRTHETLFRETLKEAGLNPFLFEFANIRDQCSWVHPDWPQEATEKAKDLVRMSVYKARLLEPLPSLPVSVMPAAIVFGGGPAGISAALEIAKSGYDTCLVEKGKELGGYIKELPETEKGETAINRIQQMIDELKKLENVKILTEASLADFSGYIGNFKAKIKTGESITNIEAGAVVIATGGKELKPESYLYGKSSNVMTQGEFSQKITNCHAKSLVMIQCVSCRDKERPYCSRTCCASAVENAVYFKKKNPESNVYILYRDVMLYGFAEETYREARSLGILFIRYEPDSSPEVSKEGEKVRVTIKSPDFKLPIEVDADLLVLSTPVVPEEHSILSELMKIPTDENGFFMEAHVKLRPLEFPTAGIFLAGMCHYPKLLDEAIAQGIGAAGRAKTILSKEFVLGGGAIASVDAKRCRGCGVCEEICQFGAITLRPDSSGRLQANVIEALCVGCGMCSVSCWSNAITMKNFSDEQIESMIVGALVKSKL